MGPLTPHIGADWWGVLGVVIATTVLYLLYTALLHLLGPRWMSSTSTPSLALVTVLGSLSARAMMGNTPTLVGALVAMATLLGLETGLRRARSWHVLPRRVRSTVVMIHGEAQAGALRRLRMPEGELRSRLRAAGVLRLQDAALVILESRGGLTVVRPGGEIDRDLLWDVDGAEHIPAGLICGPQD